MKSTLTTSCIVCCAFYSNTHRADFEFVLWRWFPKVSWYHNISIPHFCHESVWILVSKRSLSLLHEANTWLENIPSTSRSLRNTEVTLWPRLEAILWLDNFDHVVTKRKLIPSAVVSWCKMFSWKPKMRLHRLSTTSSDFPDQKNGRKNSS